MATSFHLFNFLPLELRQRIWELSLTPRRVPIGYFYDFSIAIVPPRPPPVPPPAALHACFESRSYLTRYHDKYWYPESPSRYVWVNCDQDTVCTSDNMIDDDPDLFPPIKHLSVYASEPEFFYCELVGPITRMPFLENNEIRPLDDGCMSWSEWFTIMKEWYPADGPVCFRVTILNPVPGAEDYPWFSLTPENHRKEERDELRRNMAAHPEYYVGVVVPDSDDDDDHSSAG